MGAAAHERAGAGAAVADRVAGGRRARRTPRSPSGSGSRATWSRKWRDAVCRASAGRADRRAAAGAAADDHRRAGRGGDRQDAGDARPRTRRTGRRARWPREVGLTQSAVLADLAGVRAAAAPPGDLEALQGPAVHREGPRRRRALSQPARARGRAVRGREVPDPGAGPHRADPADAARARPSAPPTTTSAPAPRASTPRWTSPPARSSARCTAATARSSSSSSCRRIDREVPADLDVHLVLDNSSTHKTPAIQTLAGRAPPLRLALHPDQLVVAEPRRALVRRADHQEAPPRRAPLRPRNSTPTSAPGSTPGTTTPSPSSGPRPPTRSSTPSPATATRINES